MNTNQDNNPKMEWVILEKISLDGLSLKDVQSVIAKNIEKYGEDVMLGIDSQVETHFSSREDSSYSTSQSFCHIKKLMPALSQEEKNKQYQDNMNAIYANVSKMFENIKLISHKK